LKSCHSDQFFNGLMSCCDRVTPDPPSTCPANERAPPYSNSR